MRKVKFLSINDLTQSKVFSTISDDLFLLWLLDLIQFALTTIKYQTLFVLTTDLRFFCYAL